MSRILLRLLKRFNFERSVYRYFNRMLRREQVYCLISIILLSPLSPSSSPHLFRRKEGNSVTPLLGVYFFDILSNSAELRAGRICTSSNFPPFFIRKLPDQDNNVILQNKRVMLYCYLRQLHGKFRRYIWKPPCGRSRKLWTEGHTVALLFLLFRVHNRTLVAP